MRVLAIGKAKPDAAEMEIFNRYAARIKPKLTLQELTDGTGTAIEIKRREAGLFLAAVSPQDFVVALDQGGTAADSPQFSRRLTAWTETGKRLIFIIGGAEGLDAAVIARADAKLSFGPATWPHMLIRPMLAEQIYRARMIAAHHPYHRAGRP